MKKRFLIAVVVVTLLLLSAALVRAHDRAPLFWQTTVEHGEIAVQRLHDAETQVYCYVAYHALDADDGNVYDDSSPSISCVKVR